MSKINPFFRLLSISMVVALLFSSLTIAPVFASNSSDFVVKDQVLIKYTGSEAVVIIPDSLKLVEIGNAVFRFNKKITSVTIPAGVLAIGNDAFAYCDNLATVNLPATLTDIGEEAFQGCVSLKAITLPASLKYSGFSPFRDSGVMTPLIIDGGKNLIYVPTTAISYTIPNTVTRISGRAFFNCTLLNYVSIPPSVTLIDQDAFGYCLKLDAVILPNNITYFGRSPFRGTGILNPILYDGGKKLLYLPENITNYTIPATVTMINAGAAMQCSQIKTISFPVKVTSIGEYAFNYCTQLASITFARQDVNVGESAFTGTAVTNPIVLDSGTLLCYVPASTKKYVIPTSITKINAGAFADCEFITDIVIPKTVIYLGNMAFDGCLALKTLVASSKLVWIGSNPFSGYKTLVVYGEMGSEIQKSAKIYGLTFVEIPAIKATTSAGIIANSSCTSKNVTVIPYGYDYTLSATKNGAKITFPATKIFKDVGKYIVTIKTTTKTKTFTFIIDRTKPKIVVKNSKGVAIKLYASMTGTATLKITDAYLKSKSITLNGKAISWPSTYKVSKKGSYIVTARDKALNTSIFSFKIK